MSSHPAQEPSHAILPNVNPRGNLWYRFIRWLARNVGFRSLGGIRSIGEENIPMTGPLIVAPNHMSYLDPPIIACSQRREVTFMAKEELFAVFLLGWLIRSLGAFPLKRGAGDRDAIRKAIDLLKSGRALLVFPEGTRGNGVTLGKITPGVSTLAKNTGAMVLPVGICGTQIVWPKGGKIRRRQRMTVVFGKPFCYTDIAVGENERENRSLIQLKIESELLALCKQAGLELRTSPSSSDSKTSDPTETGSGSQDPE